MTFGPLQDGRPTLLLVSDDNFSGGQFTQFIALSQIGPIGAIPEPEVYAQMGLGLLLVVFARRCFRRPGARELETN
jgi:hypothetical protein